MAKKQEISYTPPGEGFWDIPEVVYRGETGNYRIFEQMTSAMTQEQLAELYEQKKQKGNPHPTDAPLIWAICTSAYTLKNENPETSEKLKQFLRKGFRTFPNTLTRIIYNSSGKDKIVHNHGTSDEYSLDGKIVGPNDCIKDIQGKKVLEVLLGTSNIKQINEVSQWINKTNTSLWRLNSKPKTKYEGVASFDAGNNRLYLDCNKDISSGYPAFRVLRVD